MANLNLKQAPSSSDAEKLMLGFTRDLCVCTEGEMRHRWADAKKEAIEYILHDTNETFEDRVAAHNPIYFLAQEVFFDNVRDDPTYLYAPYHKDIICDQALDYYLGTHKDRGLLLLGPRDTYKSTFFHGAVPLWALLREYHLFGRFGRVALIHHKDKMASRNLLRIRAKLAHHKWMKQIWEEWTGKEKEIGSSEALNIPCAPKGEAAEPNFEAAGMGGSITGSHYNAIFFSDLVIEDHRFSDTLRIETQEKYASMKFLLDTVGGRRFHDGTIYHPHDLWNTFLAAKTKSGDPMYRCLVIPAGYDRARELIEKDEPHEHVLAHPYKWSMENMEDAREEFIQTYANDDFFFAQIENNIKTERHMVTDLSDIREVSAVDIHPNAMWGLFIDPAWKGTEEYGKGDFASIQVWAFEMRGDTVIRTLVDGVHANTLTPGQGMKAIFRLQDRYNLYWIAPEQTGASGIREDIEEEAIQRGVLVETIKLKDTFSRNPGQKGRRMTRFVGESQKHTVCIASECDTALRRAFEHQYQNYAGPGTLKHDDALDCASFTIDSAVREIFVPNAARLDKMRRPWEGQAEGDAVEEYDTRYCMR